ncbi:hypothetical protein KEM55_001181 [Ascosphaera atra]|nr:hypothetical protein KEM55_001181 [Ascosphaera atra]
MKFAHNYAQALQAERYPPQWLDAAIQYKALKKTIKKVENELLSLGLRPDILNLYWCPSEPGSGGDNLGGFYYTLREPDGSSSKLAPRLVYVASPGNECAIDAIVSHHALKQLQGRYDRSITNGHTSEKRGNDTYYVVSEDSEDDIPTLIPSRELNTTSSLTRDVQLSSTRSPETVEIPLSYDVVFFDTVRRELHALESFQRHQKTSMNAQIKALAARVSAATDRFSPSSKATAAAYTWREIFSLYLSFQVFFSTEEATCGQRDAAGASAQFASFERALAKSSLAKKLNREGRRSLDVFLGVNEALLRTMKFQELNEVALKKILKKFDKHTALHARPVFLDNYVPTGVFDPQETAQNVCCVISNELLSVVPQLNDYLCPICFTIAFKPVRLRCGHVFCIRCLVVMQRAEQSHCALCRDESVKCATGENFDHELEAFLLRHFPKEAKAKLRENQRASNIDVYGETTNSCVVM